MQRGSDRTSHEPQPDSRGSQRPMILMQAKFKSHSIVVLSTFWISYNWYSSVTHIDFDRTSTHQDQKLKGSVLDEIMSNDTFFAFTTSRRHNNLKSCHFITEDCERFQTIECRSIHKNTYYSTIFLSNGFIIASVQVRYTDEKRFTT